MKKIIVCAAALALFGARAHAQDELSWLQKPVLCGETKTLLDQMKNDDYIPFAKSTIYSGDQEQQIGIVLLLIKDDELLIIESFRKHSCLISISKNLTKSMTRKQDGF